MFTDGEFLQDCSGQNLTSVPHVPPDVTRLDLEKNPIKHLDKNSFPYWLPNLIELSIGHKSPVERLGRKTFKNLPNLRNLSVSISTRNVTTFLNSATKLKALYLDCTQPLQKLQYQKLFHGVQLDYLNTRNCDFEINEKTLQIPPKSLDFMSNKQVQSREVNLPGSDVRLVLNAPLESCLDLSSVIAKTVTVTCKTPDLDIESDRLDWLDKTNTNVSIKLVVYRHVKLKLGSHRFYSLGIEHMGADIVNESLFIQELLEALAVNTVHRLVLKSSAPIPRFYPLGQRRLRQLIQPSMRELVLVNYRIGLVEKFDFNLTTFQCFYCQFYCNDCFKATGLRKLVLSRELLAVKIDLRKLLSNNPQMEELELGSHLSPMDISTLDLPFHQNLKILKLYTVIADSNNFKLNLSGLVHLEYLHINNLCISDHSWVSTSNFTLSNLRRLKYLEYSNNTVLPTGSLRDLLFEGLDSLRVLRMNDMGGRFWGSMNGLQDLLHPISTTLEVLELSKNEIEALPDELFTSMVKLNSLSLRDNKLKILDGRLFRGNAFLSIISVQNNQIETVANLTYVQNMKYLRELTFSGNAFRCTCDTRRLRDWIQANRERKFTKINYDELCPVTDDQAGTKFVEFRMSWISCDNHKEQLIVGCLVSALALIGLSMMGVYYFRLDILFWWRIKMRSKQRSVLPTGSPQRNFHAFLSYSSSEKLKAEHIFYELEENRDIRFKIAYCHRDYMPGQTIADNIIRCIDESEKVILLISRQFLLSEWCEFELNFAQMRCFDEERHEIILIFVEKFEPKELPKRLQILRRHVTSLQYPDPGNTRENQNFWHKLRLSLAQGSDIDTHPENPDNKHRINKQTPTESNDADSPHTSTYQHTYDEVNQAPQTCFIQISEQNMAGGDSDHDDSIESETLDYIDDFSTTDDEEPDIPDPDQLTASLTVGRVNDSDQLIDVKEPVSYTLDQKHSSSALCESDIIGCKRVKTSIIPFGKKYHAFLSYANPDWRLAYHIFQELEDGDDVQFLIAYDCRDFVPSITIGENIAQCIDQSEKVIFLISRQFLHRAWTTFELNYAQMRSFDEGRNLIILLFLEEFEPHELSPRIRALCRQVNYLIYPNPENDREVQYFWYRLKRGLATDSGIGTDSTKYPPRREEIPDIPHDEEQDISDHNKLKAGLSTQQVNDCDAVSRTSSEGAWDQRQNIRIPGFRIQNVVWVRTLATAIGKHRFRRDGRQGRRWRRLRDQ